MARYVLKSHRFTPTVTILFLLAFCVPVCAQTADSSGPIARLVTASSDFSRPRNAISATATNITVPTLNDANAIERRAFDQTNLMRQQNGLPLFVWDADLWRMARLHSESMARMKFFAHVTPEGLRLRDRARVVGIEHYTVLGENIAYNLGYDDPGGFAVERWMISSEHRANILSTGFKAMAVGTFVAPDGSVFLTQVFITR